MTAQDRPDRHAEQRGPERAGAWGTTGEYEGELPWGVGEDSPMDEGSETAAVPPGRRGERRAGEPTRGGRPGATGRHGFGSVEPSRHLEAGPGAPPDPAPSRRTFPDDRAGGDLPDNALEEATGMHPETWSPGS
ncbi:hypothetical protein GA0074692_3272 [Micromonospora pallida]|uniref:Uncharacterized protein n=1 Tax=Micromonospora pallida TaxID=145854 RepID=A0A1C6SS35_9ACTN|nr:hypothetical protein [Micromonospora pallida]SCL32270.1 hypothetical protein GA0074692_3272 [Micromonospora pallida]